MARGTIIPLMLSLSAAALLLLVASGGASSAAAVPGDMDAIRLPTDVRGVADLVPAMASAASGGDEERPWGECCDLAMCTRSWPPICRCLDKVERCSDACKHCKETAEGSRHSCADWYKGEPGPQCHKHAAASRAAIDDDEKKGDDDEKRPWKCCSLPVCTKSWPPVCHCWDEVKRCSSACERCEKVEGSGQRRYRCGAASTRTAATPARGAGSKSGRPPSPAATVSS